MTLRIQPPSPCIGIASLIFAAVLWICRDCEVRNAFAIVGIFLGSVSIVVLIVLGKWIIESITLNDSEGSADRDANPDYDHTH